MKEKVKYNARAHSKANMGLELTYHNYISFIATLDAFVEVDQTVNSRSGMVYGKQVPGKNMFWSTCISKRRGEFFFKFYIAHC